MNKPTLLCTTLLLLSVICGEPVPGQSVSPQCWRISGENEIQLDMNKEGVLPYTDNIEMAGRRVAGIISYTIDKNRRLTLEREIFFPQLHHFKTSASSWFHDYRAYLQDSYGDELLPKLYIKNEQFVPGRVESVRIKGTLTITHEASKRGLALSRCLFPSMTQRQFHEMWTITNTTDEVMTVKVGNSSLSFEDFGAKGKYSRLIRTNGADAMILLPGNKITFSLQIMAKTEDEFFPEDSARASLQQRQAFIRQMTDSLILETPNPILNTLFAFSKIRASESIYESELGVIHSPGGGRYYVGIWANDQAEYVSPFFPYLGYDLGNESAVNTYRAFAGETNPEFKKIRYAFEIEGLVRPFLKDRGDAAMIAYGAAHFAMALGDKAAADELWPLISWCLEYCHRQLNEEGVVRSESDEMEGRIATGSANLSTSSLYYGALIHAVDLGRSLERTSSKLKQYQDRARQLRQAMEDYFGARVEGLDTYKYYKEHRFLRHWICLPLVVGIHERKDATVEALFDRLWTDNGVHVEKNSDNEAISKIFWDRGTLYALRGTFFCGATEQSLEKLEQFSQKRLLGNRVPYVVEAYPEGNMAHLSAESALYCRVFTEGLFGLEPTGLKSFRLTPRLPQAWDKMALRRIKAFGQDFDIEVDREGQGLRVRILRDGAALLSQSLSLGGSLSFIIPN